MKYIEGTEIPDFTDPQTALEVLGMTRGQVEEWIETRWGQRVKDGPDDHMDTPGMSTFGSTGASFR